MVEISFYALSIVMVGSLFYLFRSYSAKSRLKLLIGIILWMAYLFILSQSEVLRSFELPPRVPLFIVLPLIAFILIAVNRKFMIPALTKTPLHVPVLMQSFRILVELLIFATYLKGIFPQRATFEGLNFDILVGISALIVGAAVYKGFIKPRGLITWNITSIGVLLLTVFSFISSYYFSDFVYQENALKFVELPYLLLASILLPMAIFLHAFSIKQLLIRQS